MGVVWLTFRAKKTFGHTELIEIMSCTLFRTPEIDQATKDIVDGFIRNTQEQLPKQDTQYDIFTNIPKLINNLCLSFYFIRVEFNQTQYGEDMVFNDSINAINVKNIKSKWTTCSILPYIKPDCALFRLEITLKALPKNNYGYTKYKNHFCFGYFTMDINDANTNKTLNWNDRLTSNDNCVGMQIQHNLIFIGQQSIKSPLNRNFKIGDTCEMIIDFKNYESTLKVNHHVIKKMELKTDIVIPAISLYWEKTEIEITNYSFQ